MFASTPNPLQLHSPPLPPHRHLLNITTTSTTKHHRRHLAVKAAAAAAAKSYTKIPLETAGASRFVDEKTGESFIVWGDDDDDFTTPPLPPPPPPPPQKSISSSEVRKGSSVRGSVGRFGKLKAQRVRALIRSTSAKRTDQISNEVDDRRDRDRDLGGRGSNFLRVIQEEDDSPRAKVKTKTKTKTNSPSRNRTDQISIEEEEEVDVAVDDDRRDHDSDSLREKVKVKVKVKEKMISPSRGWGSASALPSVDVDPIGRFDRRQHRYQKQKSRSNADGVGSGFFSRKSFKELGCSDDMIGALRSQSFVRPSQIQAMSYAPVLQGKSCIIADQSGSGKTLAYLSPVIQSLRQEELQGLGKSSPKNPRVVVLVPTAELASQVLNNCRSISKYGVPFRSMVATGGFRQKTQLESLQQELDVLIATPGRFIYLLKEGFLELSNLKSVILDEVDILFGDEDFEAVLKSLINSAPVTAQYLFVTATLPVDIYNKLVEVFPDCEVIMGPSVHRTSSGLEELLVDCSGEEKEERTPDTAFLNKKAALLQLVEESLVPKTIIFCNKIETCRKVENILKRIDRKSCRVRVLPFHSAIEQESRLSNMKEFLRPKSNESLFLICTDRASRGIDFMNVDNVVLFDFPRDPSEYVRRVGRTARGAGGKGRAFVFAVGKQVSLARKIIQRNEKGHPLHDVPSAYELEGTIF